MCFFLEHPVLLFHQLRLNTLDLFYIFPLIFFHTCLLSILVPSPHIDETSREDLKYSNNSNVYRAD